MHMTDSSFFYCYASFLGRNCAQSIRIDKIIIKEDIVVVQLAILKQMHSKKKGNRSGISQGCS
jgi:hypothetical protein